MQSGPCLSCLSVTLVYCGQTVGRIKMPLGMEVGLVPNHIVLDGNAAPPERGTAPVPTFWPFCLLWSNSRPSQQLLSSCLLLFFLSHYSFRLLVPCGTLSWLYVSFWLDVNIVYGNVSYRIVRSRVQIVHIGHEWFGVRTVQGTNGLGTNSLGYKRSSVQGTNSLGYEQSVLGTNGLE